MKLPTLYSRTSTGAVQTWTIEVEDDSFRTIHGQLDGKLQTTEWTVCEATNIGRANERTPQEQADFEARALWQKKLDSGYKTDINDIDTRTFIEPMLAKKWEDRKDKVEFPVYSQPKLDGMRAIITKDGAKSRNGKDWVAIPHILKVLKPLFDAYPGLVLDGELYNHDLKHDFNKITSLVKKTKPTAKDLQESSEVVQFWWYDIVGHYTFGKRKDMIKEFKEEFGLPECIQVVPTHFVENSEELDELYGGYLENGYEGQMIRLDTPYECKRSSTLLKRKEFQDQEYKILDILEGVGNRSGYAGAMVFENELGIQFNSNIKGDRKWLQELLDNKSQYIGQLATVVFFNKTPDKSVPRFPFVHSIRDYE